MVQPCVKAVSNPGHPLDEVHPDAIIFWNETSLDVSFSAPSIYAWTHHATDIMPKYRIWGLNPKQGTIPQSVLGPDPISEEIIRAYYYDTLQWVDPDFNDDAPEKDAFKALTMESSPLAETTKMRIESSVTEPDSSVLNAEFEVRNYGQRKDVFVYISYGPKVVVNLDNENAMHLSRRVSEVELTIGNGVYSSNTTVTESLPDGPTYGGVIAKMFLDIAFGIADIYKPGIGLFYTIFGSATQIVAKIGEHDNPPGPGSANSFVYLAYSVTNINSSERSPASGIDSYCSLNTSQGTKAAYVSRSLSVGEQITVSVQLTGNIRLESKNTVGYPNPGRTYTTEAEYNFGQDTLDSFRIRIRSPLPG